MRKARGKPTAPFRLRLLPDLLAETRNHARQDAPPNRLLRLPAKPEPGVRGAERAFPDHPVRIWVREEFLVEGSWGFFSERIFGVNRRELLEADLRRVKSEGDGSCVAASRSQA